MAVDRPIESRVRLRLFLDAMYDIAGAAQPGNQDVVNG